MFVAALAANRQATFLIDDWRFGSIGARSFDLPDMGERCFKLALPLPDEVIGLKIGREGEEEFVVFAIAESLLDGGTPGLLGTLEGVLAEGKSSGVNHGLDFGGEKLRQILGEPVGKIDHGVDGIEFCDPSPLRQSWDEIDVFGVSTSTQGTGDEDGISGLCPLSRERPFGMAELGEMATERVDGLGDIAAHNRY